LLKDKQKRDEALKVISEVDSLTTKEYLFDENNAHLWPSPLLLAQKFAENNRYEVPLHLFKN
jgi:hypothetical protein